MCACFGNSFVQVLLRICVAAFHKPEKVKVENLLLLLSHEKYDTTLREHGWISTKGNFCAQIVCACMCVYCVFYFEVVMLRKCMFCPIGISLLDRKSVV